MNLLKDGLQGVGDSQAGREEDLEQQWNQSVRVEVRERHVNTEHVGEVSFSNGRIREDVGDQVEIGEQLDVVVFGPFLFEWSVAHVAQMLAVTVNGRDNERLTRCIGFRLR